MCGVVGYYPRQNDNPEDASEAFTRLFDESRVRGTHAYGIAAARGGGLDVTRSFSWADIPQRFDPACPTVAHTRYCQSGDWQVMENNQPLVVADMALAMNGVIHMGTKPEFEAAFGVSCLVDNDSEIFLQKMVQGRTRHRKDCPAIDEHHVTDGTTFKPCTCGGDDADVKIAREFILGISGSFAAVWLSGGQLFAGRNARRPLWCCEALGATWFASTGDIFHRAGFLGACELEPGVVSV